MREGFHHGLVHGLGRRLWQAQVEFVGERHRSAVDQFALRPDRDELGTDDLSIRPLLLVVGIDDDDGAAAAGLQACGGLEQHTCP